MERLLAMYQTMKDREAEAAFSRALAACQLQLPVIRKAGKVNFSTQKGSTQYDFARWEDISRAITPVLAEYGFSLSFTTKPSDSGGVTITAVLTHELGHSRECSLPLPFDTSGGKNTIQACGSSMSYGKRYTASFLLNITTVDEDDDGVAASDPDSVSQDELRDLFRAWHKVNPAKPPKESGPDFERWVKDTCGVIRTTDPKAWRRSDLERCYAALEKEAEPASEPTKLSNEAMAFIGRINEADGKKAVDSIVLEAQQLKVAGKITEAEFAEIQREAVETKKTLKK